MKLNPGMKIRSFLFKMATLGFPEGAIPRAWGAGAGRPNWTAWTFRKYALEAFMGNPFIYSAVLQRQIAMARIKPYLVTENSKGEEVPLRPDHPAWKLLRRPSERYQSWPAWVKAMVGYKMIGGDAFAIAFGPDERGTPNPRPPVILHPIGPNAMTVKGGTRLGYIDGFVYKDGDGKEYSYLPKEVFWWSCWNPTTEWAGLSVIKPGEKSIDMNNAARDYNKAILENGGYPGSILSTKDPTFKKAQADEVATSLQADHTGATSAGRWLILWGGLEPYKIGMTPQEMGFENLHKISAIEAALITQTPPELLGDASQKTFANYREAVLAFYTGTVIPENDDLLGNFSSFLESRFGERIIAKQDLDSIDALAGLREEAKKSIRDDFQAGIIRRREARAQGGWEVLEKDPTMDEYFSGQAPMVLQSKKGSWLANLSERVRDAAERKCGH